MTRISSDLAAALIDERPGTFRQWLHQGWIGKPSHTDGRNRSYGLADIALLKLAVALRDPDARTIRRSFDIAGGFLEPLIGLLVNEEPGEPLFAVLVRSGDKISDGFTCQGLAELGEALGDNLRGLADGQRQTVDFSVVNLSALAEEIAVDWAFAVGAGPQLQAKFIERFPGMAEVDRERAVALLANARRKTAAGGRVQISADAELPTVTAGGRPVVPAQGVPA